MTIMIRRVRNKKRKEKRKAKPEKNKINKISNDASCFRFLHRLYYSIDEQLEV